MIDPDNIQVVHTNLPSSINIHQIPPFEYEIYNLEDDKDYDKFIKDIERVVRKSFEYRELLNYLRNNCGMNKCAYLKDVTNAETYSIKIEIHHYPFSLYDIVDAVIKKRLYYKEHVSVQVVAKEVMMLHYRMMVGLIPLSETVHELFHNDKLFIPVDRVFGRYKLFVDYYGPFIDNQKLDALDRIEKYTMENSTILDTTILDMNHLKYRVMDPAYNLPDFNNLNQAMQKQIESIKNNGYLLPGPEELNNQQDNKREAINPIIPL